MEGYDKAIEQLKSVLEDEESEIAAYQRLMLMTQDEFLRNSFRVILEDSVIHAEVVRGLVMALERIKTLRERTYGKTINGDLLKEVETHITLEANVGAVYEDLKNLIDVGSAIAILETLVKEEEKHGKILEKVLKVLKKEH